MTHDDYRELLAVRALGSPDAPDDHALEDHLGACGACAAELAELAETAANLALLAPPVTPSPDTTRRLFAALDAGDGRPRPTAIPRPAKAPRGWRPLAVAARLGVAAVVAVMLVSQWQLLGRLDDATRQIAAMHEVGRFVTSPGVSVVPLWGPEGARGGAHAKIAYDHATGRFVFLAAHMPPPPAGTDYRLWVISERISPAGAVSVDGPVGIVPVRPRRDEPFFFAVSVEPSTAHPHDEPNDALVLMSPALRDPR
jgi:hypothetical protein